MDPRKNTLATKIEWNSFAGQVGETVKEFWWTVNSGQKKDLFLMSATHFGYKHADKPASIKNGQNDLSWMNDGIFLKVEVKTKKDNS